jgi:uncharacterized protein YuzE
MAETNSINQKIGVNYDSNADIMTFSFTSHPEPAIAEEIDDDIWVRYDQKSHKMISLDVLHFATRLKNTFGNSLIYQERKEADLLESLVGIPGSLENG